MVSKTTSWCTKHSMKLTFPGPNGSLLLSRETASILLQAMGHITDDIGAGEIPLFDAYIGIQKAKSVLRGRELQLLCALEDHLNELSEERWDTLEWA